MRVRVRWRAALVRLGASVVLVSLAGGWVFHAIEEGRLPAGLTPTLRPVLSTQATEKGYVYREGRTDLAAAMLVRRHMGEEPDRMRLVWWCGVDDLLTPEIFYGGRRAGVLRPELVRAIDRGVESYAVMEVGWPLPAWRAVVEMPGEGSGRGLTRRGTAGAGVVRLATRPVWPGVGVAVAPVYAALWVAGWGVRVTGRRIARACFAPVGRCPRCRYDLRGLSGPRCPECGDRTPDSVWRSGAFRPAAWARARTRDRVSGV